LKEKDLQFFSLAKAKGMRVVHLTTVIRTPMFPEDDGDLELRSQVHLYSLEKNSE
jgi:predicted nicotinamide N-methyase